MTVPAALSPPSEIVATQELPGFSGARVLLVTCDRRHWFVRKTATSAEQNQRLLRQAAKQTAFAREMRGLIRTPAILGEGEAAGRVYLDMEYVRGVDGVHYLQRASKEEVTLFCEKLCRYLIAAAERPPLTASSVDPFRAYYRKVCEVQAKTSALPADALARLFLAMQSLAGFEEVTSTLCHGDLTLENIVIDEHGTLCFVDFLDSPFEHYWQDAAKLHQDLAGGWYRHRRPAVSRYVLDFLANRIRQTALDLNPAYAQVHNLLIALTFVRILPYARTEEEIRFLIERIAHFLEGDEQ